MRLRILVVPLEQGVDKVQPLWPWLYPDWAATWTNDEVLIVLGLDRSDDVSQFRFVSYRFDSRAQAVESATTEEEKQLVQAVFKKKYGYIPKA